MFSHLYLSSGRNKQAVPRDMSRKEKAYISDVIISKNLSHWAAAGRSFEYLTLSNDAYLNAKNT